ncbi:MAG: CTP synthase [Methylocystaceae bacterium]|nr:CTP synthase [Methylocystaceae bacterium]
MAARYIFITGGVVSSLGKGLGSAALGACLQARGFKVRLRKLDPYLNVDPGTMSPYQHGEVFVTDDGAETDLDLGHYERFTSVNAMQSDNVTSGRIYSSVIQKERAGEYLGATVQVIPHVTEAIKNFTKANVTDEDFILVEIGGTVGDIESLPFLEAIRQLGNELGRGRTMFLHTTLVPYIPAAGELKTKPTQHSVKELLGLGISPDALLCRCDREIPAGERRKIALFCNVAEDAVIPALDVDTIYRVPLSYHAEGLDTVVLKHFGMAAPEPDLTKWEEIVHRVLEPEGEVNVAIVGKYVELLEAYKSLGEALTHGGIANNVKVNQHWIDAETLLAEDGMKQLEDKDAILVPGGFGERGAEGKIAAVKYAREQKVPYFGICLGMQMAVVETARNMAGVDGAGSSEFGNCKTPIVGLMTEWEKEDGSVETRDEDGDLGGTMRLGAYPCKLVPNTLAYDIYNGAKEISERHRHRYEVNVDFKEKLEAAGMKFSGLSPDGVLPEIVELPDHPFFIGVQFHPELKSRPTDPHPIFKAFVKAAIEQNRLV